MNKASLKKTVSAVVVVATIATLSPLGLSAQWRQNTDSTWNYTEGNKIAQGWENISDIWYYFNSYGKMNTGWICDKGTWYYNNNSGAMQTGWIKDNGKWYYADNTGAMQLGVIKINEKTYFLNSLGSMLVGTVKVGNKLCEFDSNGNIVVKPTTQESNEGSNKNSSVDITVLPKLPQNYDISVQATAENKIFELMNQKRTEAGLQSLTMDSTLLQVARYKSNHMIQYNYFDHTNPDGKK